MPKLNENDNFLCDYCNAPAKYVSHNSKKYRCVEKITQCIGFVKKAEASRQRNITADDRRQHMKKMSKLGNSTLAELHQDPIWRRTKGKNIVNSKVKNGSAIDPMIKSTWKKYEKDVDRYTRESWVYHNEMINPTNLTRGLEFELDHIVSKSEGFKNNVPPEIIGHYKNLRMIDKISNRKKYNKSSISIKELLESIQI